MEAGRQIVRWSIPGYTFLIFVGLFQAINELMWREPFNLIISSPTSDGISGPAVALIVASGIPIGFIIYQVYFACYGEVLPFDIVVADRGAEILKALSPDTIKRIASLSGCDPDYEEDMHYRSRLGNPFLRIVFPYAFLRLKREHRNNAGRSRYTKKRIANLSLARAYLDQISTREKSDHIEKAYTSLSDIYHSLGACRTSLMLAFIGYVIYIACSHQPRLMTQPKWFFVVALINGIVLLVFLRVLETTRRNSYLSSQDVLAYSLNWYSNEHLAEESLNPKGKD